MEEEDQGRILNPAQTGRIVRVKDRDRLDFMLCQPVELLLRTLKEEIPVEASLSKERLELVTE